ncbi:MAG: helix-turn-helix transcriptional regulator [Clostridiaceae bacterium]|jgi:putative transcriptional regulator|nr:helix-turn-helix transcriptional regulator [Clostridiaceae bacterium]
MLKDNIRNLRKAKGLSQEELAVKLNVVRQTISKWEKGLSVPDSGMLVSLAEELDTSVSTLLGETVQVECLNKGNLNSISEKLEVINLQLAKISEMKVRTIRYLLISVCAIIIVVFIALATINSEYLAWDFNDPELAIAGTLLHGFEFIFVRFAPFAFIGSVIGIVFTYRKR